VTGPILDGAPTERFAAVASSDDRDPGAAPVPERAFPPLLEQMGGVPGIVVSTIPVLVFVVTNLLTDLSVALSASVGTAVGVLVWRLARREGLQPAISGLFGVGICAFLAYRTGEARGFYLPGLIYSAVAGSAFLISVLVRRPLAGVVWHAINGDGQGWRHDPRLLRAYTFATLLWAGVFGARVLVQGWLYSAREDDWLGVARLAMGFPLVAVALLGTVWAVRRAQRTPLLV
jgi:hypothetical protein